MTEPVISFRSVEKVYRLGAERANLRAAVPGRFGRKPLADGHWALRDLSFDVHPAELVGIIGPNGAGKSTLLKLVARVIAPTRGSVCARGRLASLIELGVGFHPDLTGRDNVRFSAAILGMSSAEVNRRFDEIVAFSGIETYIDTPVKRYSSGMLARLGFSVASHLDADLLLVDEVLSVGDAEFQRRGFERMRTLRSQGATLLLVTHNMFLIPQVCQRAMRLSRGRLVDEGDPSAVVERYQSEVLGGVSDDGEHESDAVKIRTLRMADIAIATGGNLSINFVLDVRRSVPNGRIAIVIAQPTGLHCAGIDVAGSQDVMQQAGLWSVDGVLESINLVEGPYSVYVTVYEDDQGVLITHDQASAALSIIGGSEPAQHGIAQQAASWVIVPASGGAGPVADHTAAPGIVPKF